MHSRGLTDLYVFFLPEAVKEKKEKERILSSLFLVGTYSFSYQRTNVSDSFFHHITTNTARKKK